MEHTRVSTARPLARGIRRRGTPLDRRCAARASSRTGRRDSEQVPPRPSTGERCSPGSSETWLDILDPEPDDLARKVEYDVRTDPFDDPAAARGHQISLQPMDAGGSDQHSACVTAVDVGAPARSIERRACDAMNPRAPVTRTRASRQLRSSLDAPASGRTRSPCAASSSRVADHAETLDSERSAISSNVWRAIRQIRTQSAPDSLADLPAVLVRRRSPGGRAPGSQYRMRFRYVRFCSRRSITVRHVSNDPRALPA